MLPLPRIRARRLPFLLAATTIFPIVFSGCFSIKMRELRTEIQMKDARIQQLNQDMSALTEAHSQAQRKVANLTVELAEHQAKLMQLQSELGTTADKLSTTRVALNTSLESTKKELGNRLANALEHEQSLRDEIERLSVKAASLQTDLLTEEENRKEVEAKLERANADLASRADLIERLQASLDESAAEAEKLRTDSEQQIASLTATHESEFEKLKIENEKLLAETRTSSEAELAKLSEDNSRLENQLTTARERVDSLTSELRVLNDRAAERDKATGAFEEQIATLKSQVSEKEKAAAIAAATPSVAPARIDEAEKLAKASLSGLITSGAVKVQRTDDGVKVSLLCDEAFQSGTTLLSDAGLRGLQAVDQFVQQIDYSQMIVAGHTDNVPVRNMPYPDNWELAGARAAEMVRWLAAQPGSNANRIVAQSHAYHQPIGDNSTAVGRRQNRRVEILVSLTPEK